MKVIVSALLSVIFSATAFADPAAQTQLCNALSSAMGPLPALGTGTVSGKGLAGLTWQAGGGCTPTLCPITDQLAPGETFIVAGTFADHLCIRYRLNDKMGRVLDGWIADNRAKWRPAGQIPHPLRTWRGVWQNAESRILLSIDRNAIKAFGGASWQGRGAPHFGQFQGRAVPTGSTVSFQDGDCHVALIAVGALLGSVDNGRCGGENVSFSGIYHRRH